MRARKPPRSGESGQALLELALVAPVLIILLAGLVQFAFIFERQIGINNAVREAARRTAALSTPNQPTAQANAEWALDQLQTLLGNSQTHDETKDTIQVCIVNPSTNPTDRAGNLNVVVRITEAYKHPVFLPIVAQILDGIDGSNDGALLASTETEFLVEQAVAAGNNVGTGGSAHWDGTSVSTGVLCTP